MPSKTSRKKSSPAEPRGEKLRRFRRIRGLSRADVAKKLSCTVAAVGAWENGIRTPTDTLIPKYAALLALTPEQLIDIIDKD